MELVPGNASSVMSSIQPVAAVWPVHVLFVETGKGFPYSPLDEAVRITLSAFVQQLTVVTAHEPVAELAAIRDLTSSSCWTACNSTSTK